MLVRPVFIARTQSVTGGQWNDLTFNFPAGNAVGSEADTNYNQLVINTDEGNTVYVDQIVMAGRMLFLRLQADDGKSDCADGCCRCRVSLYSDTYTEEAGNFRTDWSLGSDHSVVDLAGSSVLKYENMSMAGIEPASQLDASGMGAFHLTVWRTDATADLKVKLVDFGADGGNTGIVEHEYVFAAGSVDAVATDGWQTRPNVCDVGSDHERKYCSGCSVEPRAWSARCEWFPDWVG